MGGLAGVLLLVASMIMWHAVTSAWLAGHTVVAGVAGGVGEAGAVAAAVGLNLVASMVTWSTL